MRTAKPRTDVPEEIIAGFAREFADWRLGGCPGYGFQKDFKSRVEKIARRAGRSYSELWAMIHARAYLTIDEDPRARLATSRD